MPTACKHASPANAPPRPASPTPHCSLQEEARRRGHRVLTPLVTLDTPGKASVQAVILADPDGHEVCFVGDEAFRQLSQPDENAPTLLTRSISRDGSREWAAKQAAGPGSPTAAAAPAAAPKAGAAPPAAKAAPAAAAAPAAPAAK